MTNTMPGPVSFSEAMVPPQALEAERSVLAALLLDHEAVGMAVEMLDAQAFYRVAHQKMFDAITALFNRNEKADVITLSEELRKRGDLESVGGPAALTQILEYATSAGNLEQYIRIIRSKAILRGLIKAAGEIQQEAYSGSEDTPTILDRAEERIFAITDERVREGFVHIKDLLRPAFEHIQGLFERKVLITGVPSGYDDLDKYTAGFQNSDLIIVAGRPAMGKCLTASTRIADPDTGHRVTIEECVRRKLTRVFGVSARGEVRPTPIGDWIDSGIKPCWRVTTRTGRRVEVTGHHPFLTIQGWTPLSELSVGDAISVPRALPVFGTDDTWSLERVRLLAYFIAEGGLTGMCPHFTNTDPVLVGDFTASLEREFPVCDPKPAGDGITYRVSRKATERHVGRNPVTVWLEALGLMGKLSAEKRLPDAVWGWTRERLVEFVRILFSCDGTIYSLKGDPRIEFTVASEGLAEDVHHAMTRLGIIAKLWRKTDRSWRVEITEKVSVLRYQREIGWLGEKAARFPVDAQPPSVRSHPGNVGHAPRKAWASVRAASDRAGLTLMEVARRSGETVVRGYNLHTSRGIPRARLAGYAAVLEDEALLQASSPDLYWDEIIAIEAIGEHQVYDLTVPDGSNFIANDVCVHNTSFALNMAENAAVHSRIPVAIFSLEMAKEQLVQRLLCSQGGVALHRVRNGSLSNEDWPRLTTAAGLLTQAPIMIDDSANVSLMEIRAKCRRLKSEGRLGLVVIDYLQLIRPGTAENRVQEISQITRGLKILAKELHVPIIALSQLSRAVETRDKSGRPQLSDLRESGCLTADTRIMRADTGAEMSLGELLLRGERNIPVWTLNAEMKIVRGIMTHVFPSGTKPVFALKLASGRTVKASANHPFMTLDGWKPLESLTVGTGVAVPCAFPESDTSIGGGMGLAADSGRHGLPAGMMQHAAKVEGVDVLDQPSDVFWDEIASIEPLGEQPVFDATVPGTHNFIADGICVHNSIEQDSDVVMFVYREEVYKPDTAEHGKAAIIIAKQRNGPTAEVDLTFLRESTKFVPYSPVMVGETEPGF